MAAERRIKSHLRYAWGAFCLISSFTTQAATPPSEVVAVVKGASGFFGVPAEAYISSKSEFLQATRGGVIEVGLPAVERLLQETTGETRQLLLKFILAHEVWHVHQYAQPGARAVAAMELPERRLYECQADAMAAYFLIKEGGKRLIDDPATLEEVKRLVWYLRSAEGFHPIGHQRDAAVKLGFRFALIEAMAETPQLSDSEKELLANTRKLNLSNPRETNAEASWRVCKQITQFDDGAGKTVSVAEAQHQFHPTLEFPFVHYKVTFRNRGNRAVRVSYTPQVQLGLGVCKGPHPPDSEYQNYLLVSNDPREFVIPAGQNHHLMGMLPWMPTPDRCPRIDFDPRSARTLISYQFEDKAEPLAVCLAVQQKPDNPVDDALLKGLLSIANSAELRFSELIVGPPRVSGRNTRYKANVSLPGVEDLRVWLSRTGEAEVHGNVYRGKDGPRAAKAYRELRDRLTHICPLTRGDWEESEGDDGDTTLNINRFGRYAAVRVEHYKNEDEHHVTLTVLRVED